MDDQNPVNQGREGILMNYLPVWGTKQPVGQLLRVEEDNCSRDRGRREKEEKKQKGEFVELGSPIPG